MMVIKLDVVVAFMLLVPTVTAVGVGGGKVRTEWSLESGVEVK